MEQRTSLYMDIINEVEEMNEAIIEALHDCDPDDISDAEYDRATEIRAKMRNIMRYLKRTQVRA